MNHELTESCFGKMGYEDDGFGGGVDDRRRERPRDDRRGRDDRGRLDDRRRDDRFSRRDERRRDDTRETRRRSRSKTPPQPERKKKRSLFDVTPQAMASMGIVAPGIVAPTSSDVQVTTGAVATVQPYKNQFGVLVTPTAGVMTNPMMIAPGVIGCGTAANDPLSRQVRRIYVGNIPRDATEAELVAYFNDIMAKSRISKEDAVLQATVNVEKNFAFLDFRTPEHANHAMSLDGIKLREQYILKIRRPRDYKQGEDGLQSLMPALANAPDCANKIFIGNLPLSMTEEEVQNKLLVYGIIKNFKLVMDPSTNMSKGYAFCEYLNGETDTDRAITELNGTEIDGKRLLVQRAIYGIKSESGLIELGETGTLDLSELDVERMAVSHMLNLQVRFDIGLSNLTNACSLSTEPTRVLVLVNLFWEGDLKDETKYEAFNQDMRQEASKYGRVKSIQIPKDGEVGAGKVLIEYEKVEEATRAQQELQGRKYQGRLVITTYHAEDDYTHGKFVASPRGPSF
ncbi:splicing factor U2AF 65 kDa subunit [Acrasis kona]|uniref:Splicing factor U2AF 65 kDa subunit n=1 Tax=Acrasis kona TaxID=1008807 RepID=A0AAW2ZDL0_9EUKA